MARIAAKARPASLKTKPQDQVVTPEEIFKLGFAFWGSKTLLSAIGMGLFTEIGERKVHLDEISQRLGLHGRSARDFLDALVALGMLEREGSHHFANTPATAQFLDRRKPQYIGGMLEMCDKRLYRYWADLSEGLRTGAPQNEAKSGGDLFDQIYKDSNSLKGFLQAMTGLSLPAAQAIAHKFEWKKYKSFIDVGCAQGGLPVVIARAHPLLKGIGFDLPVVKPIFEEYVEANGLEKRLSFAHGDFFKHPLPKADVVIMGHILHDWNLEEKTMLIKRAYEAVPAGGAFIVFEALIDDERRQNAFGLLMSLNMLIETRGGFDYTGADCCHWMKDAGFKKTRVEHLSGPDSMVIGYK
jgi:SAM-dependent methyltransferase